MGRLLLPLLPGMRPLAILWTCPSHIYNINVCVCLTVSFFVSAADRIHYKSGFGIRARASQTL